MLSGRSVLTCWAVGWQEEWLPTRRLRLRLFSAQVQKQVQKAGRRERPTKLHIPFKDLGDGAAKINR